MKILIAGYGYVAEYFCKQRPDEDGSVHTIQGLSRHIQQRLPTAHPTLKPLTADLLSSDLHERLGSDQWDSIVYCAGPKERSPQAYLKAYVLGLANLLKTLQKTQQCIKRFVFCSSTSVYGENNGAWLDESSHCLPTDFRGEILLQAEKQLQQSTLPYCIVRLAGIYGPQRDFLLRQAKKSLITSQTSTSTTKAELGAKAEEVIHYNNRIHVEDIAAFLWHLLQLKNPEKLYLLSDTCPTSQERILKYLETLLQGKKIEDFRKKDQTSHGLEATAKATGKRCKAEAVLRSGYRFLYPTYQEGYAAIYQQQFNH